MVNQNIKKRAIHRAKIIIGQLEGLAKAIDKEEYCTSLLQQSLSIQKSLKSLDGLLLENHLKTHVCHQMREKGGEERATKELMKVFVLSNRS